MSEIIAMDTKRRDLALDAIDDAQAYLDNAQERLIRARLLLDAINETTSALSDE